MNSKNIQLDIPIKGISTLLKRIEDYVLGTIILLVTSPVMLVIAVGIKLTSAGPVIFKQWRCGIGGRQILIYKFRTMNVWEDGYNFKQATRNDKRVTPFGAFLRRTSLDELPQFINVLQGRMSIVGPRPHPVAMDKRFCENIPGYILRQKTKPGITGLAQIKGFCGETDSLEKIEKRLEYDLEYLRNRSVPTDFKIILITLFIVLFGRDAY